MLSVGYVQGKLGFASFVLQQTAATISLHPRAVGGSHRQPCEDRRLQGLMHRKGRDMRITLHPRLGVSRKEKRPNCFPKYQLLGASSSAVLALLYLQEMCTPGCVLTALVPLTPASTSRSSPQAQTCTSLAQGQNCHWSWFGERQRDNMHSMGGGMRRDEQRKKPVGTTTSQIS